MERACVWENFDETVYLQSEKRGGWKRKIKGERLQGIADGTSSAPRPASSLAALFPGRNECLVTHCSVLAQKEREDSSCRSATEFEVNGKMKERTEWQEQSKDLIGGERKRNGRLVGAAETSKELAEWRRLQRKNLSILGLLKSKGWPQCRRESSCQVHQSYLCRKGKEQSCLSRDPDSKEGI